MGSVTVNKISIQSLNGIFNIVDELSSTVTWVRDVTVTKQVYISNNYEEIWGRPPIELYNNPNCFDESLFIENNSVRQKNESGLHLYRINNKKEGIVHIKDQHFLLSDQNDVPIGRLGFAAVVSEQEWIALHKKLYVENASQKTGQNHIIEIIKRELKVSPIPLSNEQKTFSIENLIDQYCARHTIQFTPREKVCLAYLLSGNVPKKIADAMNISVRTIEFHLDNIRTKCRCRNTLQIISQINAGQ